METNPIRSASTVLRTSLGFTIALLLAAPAGAKPRPVIAGLLQPESPTGAGGRFSLGTERRAVVDLVGLPDQRMGYNLWIYYECGTLGDDPRGKNLDALVVVFEQNRVTAIRLTQSAVLRSLIAQQKLKVTGPSYADLLR